MIIDIRKLNAQKKYEGHFEFEYSAPDAFIEIPYVKFAAPVKVSFDYELFEDNSLESSCLPSMQGQCSRCLKEASATVEGELDAYFEPRKDYGDYGYTNGVVDLKKAVEDAIMASMPYTLSCGDNCENISYNS